MDKYRIFPGTPLPLGAELTGKGVNFSLFSRHAEKVCLLLFKKNDDTQPSYRIILNPKTNRTGDCWHVFVEGLKEGQAYLYQLDGPNKPTEGYRFNSSRMLLDPYAKSVAGKKPWVFQRDEPSGKEKPAAADVSAIPKCVVISDSFDWQGDQPLNYPLWKTIIYETHVKGLSRHPEAVKRFGLRYPGTYAGVVEMIPYLKELGVSSLELLPVHEFDEHEFGDGRVNYWGYSTMAFFAPKGSYAAAADAPEQVREFKMMVRELHKAGLEIILDVVFNHTGEGNHKGPAFSFRGLDNSIYYQLEEDKHFYKNYSGCGNTVNCNHPAVIKFIIDSLRYWVLQMHVDGFRFDLASVFTRDEQGNVMDYPPLIHAIAEDAVLHRTKIIAEPWDAGGAYWLGGFGNRWAEWNDRFRDDVKTFWRGDKSKTNAFATRLSGSSDIFSYSGRKPYHSINYITSHDGFTLNDLVSYNSKHNEANGEKNQDGSDNNLSFNWGLEGETNTSPTCQIRTRIVRSYLASLLLASGTPMLLGGDEFRRTQQGNNNAYCQDNELSWLNFSLLDKHADLYRFTRLLIEFRKQHPALQRREFFSGRDKKGKDMSDIVWFSESGGSPDWNRPDNILALWINGSREKTNFPRDDADIYICCNASAKRIQFRLPKVAKSRHWFRAIDTARKPPEDIVPPGEEVPLNQNRIYPAGAYSLTVIISKEMPGQGMD
ncbi:MAG: glycogen debranching enzyme GlgX [Spirochaeta sp. LUC14_002_19_P3]|nr:MAG: glycogen debranching enzyme GlgX [Spirochaeta sp. LUC14_002_19_P3]